MKINFDAPPTSAQETNGLEVRYAAAKRRVPRWRWYLLLAMVLVAPAYLLVRFGIAYWWVSTPAQVVLEQATLRAPAAGRVAFVAAPGAPLEPGLSLGRFSSEEAAQRALTDLGRKGVRTARVVQERRDTPAYLLRLPNADAALRQQVRGLRGALAGKELRGCE